MNCAGVMKPLANVERTLVAGLAVLLDGFQWDNALTDHVE